MKRYSFEKLEVWKISRLLTKEIYSRTNDFPKEEQYGLTSQMRRAALSVTCNISEGTSRWSYKEKIRYVEIAFSSLMETLNCIILAFDLDLLNYDDLKDLRIKVDEIANKLNSLKRAYNQSINKQAAISSINE